MGREMLFLTTNGIQ